MMGERGGAFRFFQAHGGQVLAGLGLLAGLPSLLRRPMRPRRARQILRQRLDRRAADFLALIKGAVFTGSSSPYRWLFALAGCEYGDLERLVVADGLEAALRTLFRQGVYLSVDEFKGRIPLRRGSASTRLDPSTLRNPWTAWHVPVYTSGSRGERTMIPLDLAWYRARSVNISLWLDAHGGLDWQHATWSVPGGTSLNALLEFAGVGSPLRRWFTPIDLSTAGLDPRYQWSARLLHWAGRALLVPMPRPEFVSVDDPLPIARWLSETLRAGGIPNLDTFPSLAVRVCQAASAAGLDLTGARFFVSGEPTTAARVQAIRRSGGQALPRYGTMESGPIGFGCLLPRAADDIHLFNDLHALVRVVPESAERFARTPLLISSLRRSAPLVLLNVSLGDVADLAPSRCGCPLEALGWGTSLSNIRSVEKLTAGGMTFLDSDVISALEARLPELFGGGPTDYQLLESEGDDGLPHLTLLVHPRVGPVDEAAVGDAFLSAIGGGEGPQRVMELHLRQARLLEVRRDSPYLTASGKIQHLHVEAPSPSAVKSPAP